MKKGGREKPAAFDPLERPETAGRLIGRQLRETVLDQVPHGVAEVGRGCGAGLEKVGGEGPNVDRSEGLVDRVKAGRLAALEPALVDDPGARRNFLVACDHR